MKRNNLNNIALNKPLSIENNKLFSVLFKRIQPKVNKISLDKIPDCLTNPSFDKAIPYSWFEVDAIVNSKQAKGNIELIESLWAYYQETIEYNDRANLIEEALIEMYEAIISETESDYIYFSHPGILAMFNYFHNGYEFNYDTDGNYIQLICTKKSIPDMLPRFYMYPVSPMVTKPVFIKSKNPLPIKTILPIKYLKSLLSRKKRVLKVRSDAENIFRGMIEDFNQEKEKEIEKEYQYKLNRHFEIYANAIRQTKSSNSLNFYYDFLIQELRKTNHLNESNDLTVIINNSNILKIGREIEGISDPLLLPNLEIKLSPLRDFLKQELKYTEMQLKATPPPNDAARVPELKDNPNDNEEISIKATDIFRTIFSDNPTIYSRTKKILELRNVFEEMTKNEHPKPSVPRNGFTEIFFKLKSDLFNTENINIPNIIQSIVNKGSITPPSTNVKEKINRIISQHRLIDEIEKKLENKLLELKDKFIEYSPEEKIKHHFKNI